MKLSSLNVMAIPSSAGCVAAFAGLGTRARVSIKAEKGRALIMTGALPAMTGTSLPEESLPEGQPIDMTPMLRGYFSAVYQLVHLV